MVQTDVITRAMGLGTSPGLDRFARDTRAAVALIFALALIPIALAIGAAVDMGRAYVVRARLSYALDAAGLAVGSAPTNDEAELNAILLDYFDANYPEEKLGVAATPTMTMVEGEIHLSATALLPTTLMNIVGIHELEVAASSVIVKEAKGLEVAMVLDITGSMAGGKLDALKQASHAFVDILFGDNETNPNLKIGIVPFSITVNLGTDMTGYVKDSTGARFGTDTWKGCVEVRPGGHDVTDSYVASDTAANGRWRAFAWPSHSTANNWPPITATTGPNKNCSNAQVLPMTSSAAPLHARIDELTAQGSTHINVGAVWGWRLISPDEPYTEGEPYDSEDNRKAVVIMTDGDNVISVASGQYSAYGTVAEATAKLGCSTQSCKEAELDERLLTVCDSMKALDITVYTVGFDLVGEDSALAMLEDCATSPGHFFNSPTNEDLQNSFEAISIALSSLRIGQ